MDNRTALMAILSRVRLLRRSCDGWEDRPGSKSVAQMTLADLREEFAHIEIMAHQGLGHDVDGAWREQESEKKR